MLKKPKKTLELLELAGFAAGIGCMFALRSVLLWWAVNAILTGFTAAHMSFLGAIGIMVVLLEFRGTFSKNGQ